MLALDLEMEAVQAAGSAVQEAGCGRGGGVREVAACLARMGPEADPRLLLRLALGQHGVPLDWPVPACARSSLLRERRLCPLAAVMALAGRSGAQRASADA